jgi:hypothetical protein
MPSWEIAVAIALLIPSARRLGLAGVTAIHLALIAILGPLGLGHSMIVLVWNAAMLVEAWVLFAPDLGPDPKQPGRPTAIGRVIEAAFWIAVVLPLGERWGLLDSWPAHALYASHTERTEVLIHEDGVGAWPKTIRPHMVPLGFGPWFRLELTAWSRAVCGVPVYPQGRACNGLAEALAARYGDRGPVRLIQWSRAAWWTGQRRRVECIGAEAIRRHGDRYWLNAHPSLTPERP